MGLNVTFGCGQVCPLPARGCNLTAPSTGGLIAGPLRQELWTW